MSVAERFNWAGSGIEITKPADDEMYTPDDGTKSYENMETKTRHVRDASFWGAPYGTPITAGMRAAHREGGASAVRKLMKGGKQGRKTPSKATTKPRGSRVAETPKTVTQGRTAPKAADRARGIERLWGEDADNSFDVRRKNVARGAHEYKIEYASKSEVTKARVTAIERARSAPQPDKPTIARNKWIIKEFGGPGTGAGDIRGDAFQRSQRSWDVYVAFGGVDANGKDRGYVPCLGCGVKMSWHDDPKFTSYPKFEHDKIITTGDGGSYNTQNVVPMCAGCNNQRGNKKFWEAPVFKPAKPKWYTPNFQNEVQRTRPNKNAKFKRPKSESAPIPMPVPPGKVRIRKESKGMLDRLESFWSVTDADKRTGDASNGDRVRAQLWNFDGRHDDVDAGVFPPDVDDPTVVVVGRLVMETVDSAFGSYERYSVVEDDGSIQWVEQDTIEQVAGAPDYDDETAFAEDTNSGGGGGGSRGRPARGNDGRDPRIRTRSAEGSSAVKALERATYLEWKDYCAKNQLETKKGDSGIPGVFPARLRRYWLGEGLARWATTATPYRSLVAALRSEGVPGRMVNGLAARLYHWHFGIWPGKRNKKDWDEVRALLFKFVDYEMESK